MSATLFAWMAPNILKNHYICQRILVDKHSPKIPLNCNKSNDD